MIAWVSILLLAAASLDLDQVRAIADPPKRAVRAIDLAGAKMTEARDHAQAYEFDRARKALDEVAEAAELALEATQAKRNVSAMKKVEQKCRDLLRRMETFKVDLPFDEREWMDPIERRVQVVQEQVLAGIMSRKR
jgi:hypothetical protein